MFGANTVHKLLDDCPEYVKGKYFFMYKDEDFVKMIKGWPFSGFVSSQTVPGPVGRAIW